jgi:hypothetical protein
MQAPSHLPAPIDDGACAHLPGLVVPSLLLPSTAGRLIDLSKRDAARTRGPLPEGWDLIPGARVCTPQACAFRRPLPGTRRGRGGIVRLEHTTLGLSARNGRTLASAVRNPERCQAHLCERSETSHIRGGRDTAHQATDLDYPWRPNRNRVLSCLSFIRERRASHRVA